ncbi:hypothetical protein OSB04_004259 [Centaurea solstitialis]|uniref:Uncharacterized protein n=1 Tax=Centaurea solstitialis TaxID=347529 RepID=A0AA38U3V7_9ASTR|nr:hypothetical protein OSB04_004259 [Centaurea solstitialis]
MGHGGGHTCCNKQKVKRGLWSPEEDEKLINYITSHGHGCWSSVPKLAGLQRCGKSCRLRWINYLRPDLKRGSFSSQEASLIVDLHRILGNRWAQIAKHLPGRTDNEVKNFWNSSIKKKLLAHTHLSNHPLTTTTTTFSNPKTTNINHVPLSGDHQYYEGLFDANPNVINSYQPHMIQDQDHHVHTPPPPATTQPPLINIDKCFGIDSSPILPPLPPSFVVNSSSDFDHQFPTMEFLNSYDHHDILKPEVIGVQEFHHPETPFKLGDIELAPSITQPIVNSNDLHTHASSQMEYLETFMANFPSSSPLHRHHWCCPNLW